MSAASTPMRRPVLPALNGLRALAAADILFFHFLNPAWFGPFTPLASAGYVGVNFFFILSGFILAYNYTDKQEQGKFSARQFWRNRLLRLYPVYVLGLLISLPILRLEWLYQTRAHFWQGLTLTPLMLQGISPILATFWNTPAWTLSCEVAFYLLFPWLLTLRWPETRRGLTALLGVLWIVALILPVLYMLVHPDGAGPINRYSNQFWLRAVKLTPLPHVPAFLFGIALSRLNDRVRLSDVARFAMATLACSVILAILWQGDRLPFLLVHNGLLAPIFAVAILGLAGQHPLTALLGAAPLVFVGEASYCLYLIHFNLWQWIHASGLLTMLHLAQWDPWVSYLMLELAALAAYHWVELPGRGWMQRLLPEF